jgi:hypothetical protein
MKQIFTLFAILTLSIATAFGQETQNFEGMSNLSTLTTNCWQFNRVDFAGAATGNIGSSNNVLAQTTDKKNNATIVTPFVNLYNGSVISFDYKLNEALNGAAKRTITVRLLDITGVYTDLESVVLDKNTAVSTASFTTTVTSSSIQRVVIEMAGSGDGNSNLNVDNIYIGGTFNFNSPYGCNTSSASPLSIHYLKTFQGLLTDNTVQLQWSVAENENNNYFEIERSADSRVFKTIAIVAAAQNAGDMNYSYKDPAQSKAFYRLKVVSKGNKVMYTNVLFFKNGGNVASTLSILQNPVLQTLKFDFKSDSNTPTEVAVYNTMGVKVYATSFVASKGNNFISTAMGSTLKTGTYVLEVKNTTNRSVSKFLKN